MLGLTDYQSNCRIAELADVLAKEDRLVMDSCRKMTFVKSLQFHQAEDTKLFFAEKAPLFDFNKSNHPVGVSCLGFEVSKTHPVFKMLLSWHSELLFDNSKQFSFTVGVPQKKFT